MSDSDRVEEIGRENAAALEELAWAIEASGGNFELILARCNYSSLRQRITRHLRQRCTVEIQELVLDPAAETFYSPICYQLEKKHPEALLVFGLESLIHMERALEAANRIREDFRKRFPFPLVLWVDDTVHRKLIRLAPDFESWATTVEFAIAPADLLHSLRYQTDRLFASLLEVEAPSPQDSAVSLGLTEVKAERTPQSKLFRQGAFHRSGMPHFLLSTGSRRQEELQAALADIHKSGLALDPALQASLNFVNGREAYKNQQLETARSYYEQSLAFWQQSKQLEREGCLHFYLGLWWRNEAELNRLAQHHACTAASTHLQQCMTIFRQLGRLDLVASWINALGEVLQKLEQWQELETLAQEALTLNQTFPNALRLAATYGFLAEVALQLGNWAEANQYAQKALDIVTEIPESQRQNKRLRNFYLLLNKLPEERQQSQSRYLFLLARSQQQLDQVPAALSNLERARSNGPQDDPSLHIHILSHLHGIYFEQHEYLHAFRVRQEKYSVERQYGFRAFIGAGQPKSRRWGKTAQRLDQKQTAVTQNIAVSGRQQDVNRLLERIGSTQHKLTILYGQSGVGKSSLLEGGLVPSLQEKAIGTRDVIPLSLKIYTDWMGELEGRLGVALRQKKVRLEHSGREISSEIMLELLRQVEQSNLLVVLIFDQFEDFFVTQQSPDDRQQFFEFFRDCLAIPFVKVLLSLREDYLHLLLQASRQIDFAAINNNILDKDILYYVGNFLPEDASTIICSLTERCQLHLEPALVEALVQDLSNQIGEVRPIELQVVGAQLEAEKLTTLAQYRECGPKEMLVKRYLEAAIANCGPENASIARLSLYFLTDENNERPPKTQAELERDLVSLGEDLSQVRAKLDLVFKVLVESGLVFLLPDVSAERYQLVHDYLVAFIRRQQEPEVEYLIEALEDARAQHQQESLKRQQAEEAREQAEQAQQILEAANQKARRRIQIGSAILVVAVAIAALLGVETGEEIYRAQTVNAIDKSGYRALQGFESSQLEALMDAVEAGEKLRPLVKNNALQNYPTLTPVSALQQILDGIREKNQFSHDAPLKSASFSPDVKLLATASTDGTVSLWDIKGQKKRQISHKHTGPLTDISFSPDGRFLATASRNSTAQLWTLYGEKLFVFEGHKGAVNSIRFSSNGQRLVTASSDGTAHLWNLEDEQLTTKIEDPNGAAFWQAQFSPNGQQIATAAEDGIVQLWNLQGEPLKSKQFGKGAIASLAFSPDGQYLAAGGRSGITLLWNLQNGSVKECSGHTKEVTSVSFSVSKRYGDYLATASKDKDARLWDLNCRQLEVFRGHSDILNSIGFSPDGRYVVTASEDKTARLWDLSDKQIATFRGHTAPVSSVSFSPDGASLATASEDKTVRLWNLQGKPLQPPFSGHGNWVSQVSFSPDGQLLATASKDSTARLWNLKGNPQSHPLENHEQSVSSVDFSPDGQQLVTASKDGTARLWTRDGQEIQKFEYSSVPVWDASFSPNGRYIATASADGTARLWNLNLQEEDKTFIPLEGHEAAVTRVQFSPNRKSNRKSVATVSEDHTAKLWKLDGTEILELQGHHGPLWGVSFDPDGQLLATASSDRTVRVWDLTKKLKNEPLALFRHRTAVRSVSFSPDGKFLATASDDNLARLWRMESLDELLTRGCSWLQEYLTTNPDENRDRKICS